MTETKTDSNASLLIDETPLALLPTLAGRIGVTKAILLQVIATLVQENGHIMDDGKQWAQLTYRQVNDMVPFWGVTTLQSRIKELVAQECLYKTHEVNGEYDPLNWYCIRYDKINEKLAETPDQYGYYEEW